MKPNFLIIGAMKCGTTSLSAYLRQHPDIFVPDPKDIYFFSNDEIYAKGWDWYISHFKDADACTAIGEGTDNYSKKWEFPNTAKRIKKHLPDTKLIYITRNPIRQIESAWSHLCVMNGERLPFEEAIFQRKFYIDNCRYLNQVNVYRELYPEHNIKVLFLEDLIRYTDAVLEDVFRFLGVRADYKIQDKSARNTRAGRYGDRLFTQYIRKIPGTENLVNYIPENLKSVSRPFFKWHMKHRPEWKTVKKKFIDIIREETIDFLTAYGKPKTYWNLES